MAAKSKTAKVVRKASDFDIRALVARLESMRVTSGAVAWSLAEIQQARDAQMLGQFARPARLAESFRTDDAMYVARRNRLAPQRALPIKIVPARESAAGLRIAAEGAGLYGPNGIGVTPETRVSLHSQLVDHGVAFFINTVVPREDGSRADLFMRAWPIEFVRWNPSRRSPIFDDAGVVTGTRPDPGFVTTVDPESLREAEIELKLDPSGAYTLPPAPAPTFWNGSEVNIDHADGRWGVIFSEEIEPWKSGCVLPGALAWARHAFGFRDWGKGSAAHGNAKVVGTMAQGIGTQDADGIAYLDLMRLIAEGDAPYGIKPFGYELEYITNDSAAWQIFQELVKASEISASRIYIGQDGSLGTNGSGPGIDLRALFGVTNDIVEGDLHALERGIKTGYIDVHTALNFGTSELAPSVKYEIPDADAAEEAKSYGERMLCFERDLDALAARFVIDQAAVRKLADRYGVDEPLLKAAAPALPAPTSAPQLPAGAA